jgi:leader peptidase (prepilin peptidase)/N-methyltransferase
VVLFFLGNILLVPVLFRLTWWDQLTHRLPDSLTLPALGFSALAVMLLGMNQDVTPAVNSAGLAVAITVLLLWLLSEAPGHPLGFGDVKLGALLSLHLGIHQGGFVVPWLAFAFVVGGLHALWLVSRRVLKGNDMLPFGPYMVMAWLVVLASAGAGSGVLVT